MGFSAQSSGSENSSGPWSQQQPYLQNLYGMGQQLAQQQFPQIGQAAQGIYDKLSSTSGDNPWINNQTKALGQGLANQWNNTLLPGINSSAQMGGNYNNDRLGIAQGLGAQGVQQAYGQGASGIMQNYLQQVPNLFQMAMSPYTAPWQMLNSWSQSMPIANTSYGSSSSSGMNAGLWSHS